MGRIKNCLRNKPRRKQRQEEAKVRQETAAKRSPVNQLARLDAAKLVAARERARLTAKLPSKEVDRG